MNIFERLKERVAARRVKKVFREEGWDALKNGGKLVYRVGDLPPVIYQDGDTQEPDIDGLFLRAGLGAKVSVTTLDRKRREVNQVTFFVSPANIATATEEINKRGSRE